MLFFFFFKQKTAYEMRISDWSSDVCSSDLRCARVYCSFTHGESSDNFEAATFACGRARRKRIPEPEPGINMPSRIAQRADKGLEERLFRPAVDVADGKIGRASCRERVCQYV